MPCKQARATDKGKVRNRANPAEQHQVILLHERFAARIPQTLANRRIALNYANRQQAGHNHQTQAAVEQPEADGHVFGVVGVVWLDVTAHQQHKAQSQEAIHAEQCAVRVHRSGIQALQEEQGNRRVNQEAEHARAQHIPERNGGEAHQRPAQTLHPRRSVLVRPMLIRLMTEQHQRHHFQSRERSTGCHNRRGSPREIQVVERTGHAADQEQAACHQRSRGG